MLNAAWFGRGTGLALTLALFWNGAARSQEAGTIPPALDPALAPAPALTRDAASLATDGVEAAPGVLQLPDEIQVVRFHGPAGLAVEVLEPPAEALPMPPDGNSNSLATFGLRVGVSYRLRLSNLPERPGESLYPVVELVGHLHRPPGIDPLKYPIRIALELEDLQDVAVRSQMVTHVVYLEDPETALPIAMPRDTIPVVTLSPVEDPLKVASALGRVMAVVRLGGRQWTPGESAGMPMIGPIGGPCPFIASSGGPCGMPCGPAHGTAPPPGQPWMPRDEYLCDGGDFQNRAAVAGDGALRGIDPRDAVVRFRDDRQARVLPTNVVCVYAPRFAAVRTSLGLNQTVSLANLRGAEMIQGQESFDARIGPKRMAQTAAPQIGRHRSRASTQVGRVNTGAHFEVRVLAEEVDVTLLRGAIQNVGPEAQEGQQELVVAEREQALAGIKTAEGLVLEGIVQGASAQVMAWKPTELSAVEVPPNKPGMAVVKQVDSAEAEPGDALTYTITYRNVGNIPVTAVSITDSLLPRLEYVKGSAKGPAGTVFTAAENLAGSTELRWEIGTVAPGAQGSVQFQASVR